MKQPPKPKVTVKATKVIVNPTAKIKKPVVQPKIQIKKIMADNTRVKKNEKDFTPAPKYDRLNYFAKGTPTKSDSINYRKGYKIGAVGRKVNSPELFNIQKEMGQQEGMDYFKSKLKNKK